MPEEARWVLKNFERDECDARERPYARRAVAVPKSHRLNHVVGIDFVAVKCPLDDSPQFWINNVCT
eukprot:1633440-Pyramimonas_sp.AAC.1